MKLFVIAALVAVASAGRLEHLERSYLPPDNSVSGGFNSGFRAGPSARGSQGFNQGSNGFGNQGSNGFGNHGSNGFGNHGSNAFGNDLNNGFNGDDSHGSNSFGSGSNGALNAASLKQYLPPDQPASGSGLGFSGSAIRPACATCGFSRQQYSSPSSQYAQAPSTQYGQPPSTQYGQPSSQYGQPQFGASSFNNAGARASFGQSPSFGQSATNRQYLAPKAPQEIPQQAFDEQTGYHY